MEREETPRNAIRLDQFLKLVGAVRSGGEAKARVRAGEVLVNGEIELRRGRKLRPDDRVEVAGSAWTVRDEAGPAGDDSPGGAVGPPR